MNASLSVIPFFSMTPSSTASDQFHSSSSPASSDCASVEVSSEVSVSVGISESSILLASSRVISAALASTISSIFSAIARPMCCDCLSASAAASIISYLRLIALFRSSKSDMCSMYQSSLVCNSTTANLKSLSNSSAIENTLPSRSFSRVNFSSIFCNSGSRCSTCLLDLLAFISRSLILASFSVKSASRLSFSISLSTISFSRTSTSALVSLSSASCCSYAAYNLRRRSVSSSSFSVSSLIWVSGVMVPVSDIYLT